MTDEQIKALLKIVDKVLNIDTVNKSTLQIIGDSLKTVFKINAILQYHKRPSLDATYPDIESIQYLMELIPTDMSLDVLHQRLTNLHDYLKEIAIAMETDAI